jgi:hypothetical protein
MRFMNFGTNAKNIISITITFCPKLNKSSLCRYLRIVDFSSHIILQKIQFNKSTISRYKNKADGPTRQVGQQGRCANKAGEPGQ